MFGVQIATNEVELVAKACEVINNEVNVDFVDLNVGCPVDEICHKGMGAMLMQRCEKR